MTNLSHYHHYSQEDKLYEREDILFTLFISASFFFDVASIMSEVKIYCNVVFFTRVRLCSCA